MRFVSLIAPDPAQARTEAIRSGGIPAMMTFLDDGTVELIVALY